MAFGLNKVQIIGRLGADVTVNALQSGGRVANMSVATDESYMDKQAGSRVDRTEWHRIVTFQDGLIEMLERHARKGRLVYVEGKLQTRRWKKAGEETERSATEILLVPGSRGTVFGEAQRRLEAHRRRRPTGRLLDRNGQRDSLLEGIVLHRLFLSQGAGPACLARGVGPLLLRKTGVPQRSGEELRGGWPGGVESLSRTAIPTRRET